MRWMTVLRVLFYSFLAIPASAQTTFAGLNQKGVDTIFVTDRAGHETKGLLVGLTDSTVTVVTAGGPQTFVADDVVRLDRRGDSLKNGALIGMGIGVIGMLPGLAEGHATCDHACTGKAVGFVLMAEGLYAAIGAGIDAAIPGRTRIWPLKGSKSGGPIISVSPHSAFAGFRIR
jgi:hypothetical protein